MKLIKLIVTSSLLVFLTTGCSITSESPEELIKDKPIYSEEKYELFNEIKQLLPKKSNLILPGNSNEVGKINEVDLDGDGTDEVIIFEKKENPNEQKNEVGFMTLSTNEYKTYTYVAHYLEAGDNIEYANFYDLNGNGKKEIVLLIKNVNKTSMHIYSYEDEEVKEISTIDPVWINDRANLLDMKIKVGHIDDDKILDMLLVHYDSKKSKVYTSLVNFDKDLNLKLIDFEEFSDVRHINNLYVSIDNISSEKIGDKTIYKKGFILDIPIIQDSNYITQILYIKDNKLSKAFEDTDKNIMKPYYIPIEDINKDKVIEIPKINGRGDVYTSKNSANISWYKWNGKEEDKSGLVFVSQRYYNYQYNYKMNIPNNLANNIIIQNKYKENNDVSFVFYYYDNILSKREALFTIDVVTKNLIEDKKNTVISTGIPLGESNEYSFILYKNNQKELEKLKIDDDALRENFSLIY